MTPSSVASSAVRGPSTSPARVAPGRSSSADQSSSSGTRRGEDERRRAGQRPLAAAEQVPQAAAGDLGVVLDRDPALVEPREIEVALVLVQRVARARRGTGQRHLAALLGERLRSVEPLRAAAPVGHEHRAVDRGGIGDRGPGVERGVMADAVAHERPVVVGVGGPLRRVRPRAGREHDDAGDGLVRRDLGAEPQLDARPLQRPGRVACQRRHSSRCAGARPASRNWPPTSAPRSASTTSSPCASACSAAATPAGPAPITSTRRARSGPARRGSVRSRPVHGLTTQAIGSPAW